MSFFTHKTTVHSILLFLGCIKKEYKTKYKMNSVSVRVNLYNYSSNFANLHIFSLTNMSDFEPYICKIESFFKKNN